MVHAIHLYFFGGTADPSFSHALGTAASARSMHAVSPSLKVVSIIKDVGKNEKVHEDGCDPQENDLHQRTTGPLT